jgi:monothiol glutaredoxin
VLNKSTRGASPACLSRTSVFLLTSFLSFPSSGIISARRVYAFLSLYVDTYALTLCAGLGLCCGAHFALSRPPSRAPTHTVLHTRRKDRGRITCVSPPRLPIFLLPALSSLGLMRCARPLRFLRVRAGASLRAATVLSHSPCRWPLTCCASAALRSPAAALHTSCVCHAASDVPADLAKDIRDIIGHDRLVVFLTGTPEQPRCRFTVQLVDLLNQLGIKYSFFNILDDDEICEGLKQYSDWPTYPQVYLDGELLGGYDICKDMMLDGSLIRTFKEKQLM